MRYLFAIFASLLIALPAFAGQPESEDAVTNILFDENMENVSYSFRGDGFVDILFGLDVPEKEYIRIVERMRKDPAIPGVLAGRGKENYCPVTLH
jgi:hypothetical protein